MNKLYHIFYVSDYKGGELHSTTNLTFEKLAGEVDLDIDELREIFADDERSQNISDEEWDKLTDLELVKLLPDDVIEEAIERYFYPGNIYAFDTRSDYEIYETSENGELKEINPCEIPGFTQLVKDNLIKIIEKYGSYSCINSIRRRKSSLA